MPHLQSAERTGDLDDAARTRAAAHEDAHVARLAALDQPLHEERLKRYPQLMQLTSPLAIYFPHVHDGDALQCLTAGHCEAIGEAMSRWCFSGGGILVSARARERYFALATAIAIASRSKGELHAPKLPAERHLLHDGAIERYRAELGIETAAIPVAEWTFGRAIDADATAAERFQDYVLLQTLSSALRTELSEDLGGRRRPAGLEGRGYFFDGRN